MRTLSNQQMNGLALILFGVAVLILSAGCAWVQSRRSRAGRVQGAGIFTAVSFLLFLAGIVLCYFGVSTIVEGSL